MELLLQKFLGPKHSRNLPHHLHIAIMDCTSLQVDGGAQDEDDIAALEDVEMDGEQASILEDEDPSACMLRNFFLSHTYYKSTLKPFLGLMLFPKHLLRLLLA